MSATSRSSGLDDFQQLSNLAFEPWQHVKGEWLPPTNEQWADLANPHLVIVRLAWSTLYKSKADLMSYIDALDNDTGAQVFAALKETAEFFKGISAIIEGAEARLYCAAAAEAIRQETLAAQTH